MKILSTQGWEEYSLLDSGEGFRLEQFGRYRLIRPDPQCIWESKLSRSEWEKADAVFGRDKNSKEGWNLKSKVPEKWEMRYKDLRFYAKLTPFKHTGVFPEQHLQWEWMIEKIKNQRSKIKNTNPTLASSFEEATADKKATAGKEKLNILNLFAYTGIASLVASQYDCDVTHVDASYPTIAWARENQALSNLYDKPIRWIKDDAIKFCEREVRRGHKYDGIIMDPPVYGHGPGGEVWDFNKSFPQLLRVCRQLLSDNPIFIIINAYAVSASALMLENVLSDHVQGLGGEIEVGELCLEEKVKKRLLSTGIFARWNRI